MKQLQHICFNLGFLIIGVLICLLTFHHSVQAQTDKKTKPKTTRILFLLDGSGSMMNLWHGDPKIVTARKILTHIVDSLAKQPNVEMALRVYGHTSPQGMKDCKDTRLEVSFGPKSPTYIKEKLTTIKPKGTTPIAYSLEQATKDFYKRDNVRNIIILITDGQESCEGDPCAISLALQKKGIFLKPFVIGMGLDLHLKDAFECMGTFYNAKDAQSFEMILEQVVTRIVNHTAAKVNLLDESNRASETDANMTFYDNFSDVIHYDYYHTFNHRGLSDTIALDPVNTYNITVHTLPTVEKKNVVLEPDKNNVIDIPAPQGYMELKLPGKIPFDNANNKIKCLVWEKEGYQTMNVQDFETKEKYLVGTYDLEILTLPRIKMKDVKVRQSHTTTIEIPTPGILTITKNYDGFGGVFEQKDNRLIKLHSIGESSRKEIITMQPGHYVVIFRPKFMTDTESTIEKEFEIKSGMSTNLKL